ncbi:hypothetical protein [Mycolicibacterium litorale]|uniref:hypothetical protein n=1 Tax=Mycolicibacterium litorale TaxID=758802 RepID=UPI0016259A8A|nr:hypothetical protein [Mycolicibacterium litorale]
MAWKWLVAAVLLMTAVVACTHEPPPYESRYTPPPPPLGAPAPLPPGASFVDTFDRPDTQLGLGEGWDLRESIDNSALPLSATDGFIRAGRYASASMTNVFAVRKFRSKVRRIGAEASWTRVGDGPAETLFMAISANEKITSDLVQLAVNPAEWEVSTRRNGHFWRVVRGRFDPPLDLDRDYRFEMDAADGSITATLPNGVRTGRVGTSDLLSERAFWRHGFDPADPRPAGARFAANIVWVAEEGQTLVPVPSADSG